MEKASLSASRFNRKARERLLYIATGLVILVVMTIITWLVQHWITDTNPGAIHEKTALACWAIVAIHLIILAVLIMFIWLSRHGGRLRKIGLIIPGIIMILMSMILVDAASTYMEPQTRMLSMAIILFISAFCDMMTGIIMIMLPVRLPENQHKTL